MAKSTYLQLVNRTIRECGISGGTASAVTGQVGILQKVVVWVSEADLYIQRSLRDWNFLYATYTVNTVPTSADYVKPADVGTWDLDSFYLDFGTTSAQKLTILDYLDWRKSVGAFGDVQTVSPSYISVRPNGDLILSPIPSIVRSLHAEYWALPTKLVASTDTSAIPEQFEDVIVHRAKVLYAQHEEAGDMLQLATTEYDKSYADLMSNQAPNMLAINSASIDAVVEVM